MKEDFYVIIPARMASSRLPEKPIKPIAGVPMVARVAERAMLSHPKDIYVATDDTRIVQACIEHRVKALLTQTDHQTGTDRLSEAVSILQLPDDAIVVNVQGDEPLIPPQVIRDVAQLLAQNPDCQIATAAHEINTLEEFLNPNAVKVVVDANGKAITFSRAPIPWPRDAFRKNPQVLPTDLHPMRHVGLYAYRVKFLKQFPKWEQAPIERQESLEQLRALWHGVNIAVMVMPGALPPGVDTQEDLDRVCKIFEQGTI